MANKWIQKLQKMEGALVEEKDRFAKIAATFSPSANFIYGNSHGLPLGFTTALYGPPKGGKSVLAFMTIGWLHQTDPEAIVVKFDTEYRHDLQLPPSMCPIYGIDPERLMVVQTNSPKAIFDQIEKDIAAHCQAGAPIKMILIDSVSGIQGRREMQTESVEKQTIGDQAHTVQIGLKRILPVIRKYDIGLMCILQVRAEMDMAEQMRGNKFKMQAGFGLQHTAEYFVAVEPNKTLAGRKDLLGNEFVNENVEDLAGKGEQVAMKIRVKMKDSTAGPKGRSGEFTFDFKQGLINVHEEVYRLGVGYGVIEKPKQGYYAFNGEQWHGEKAKLEALESQTLCDAVIAELHARDRRGDFKTRDKAAEAEEE